MRVGAESIRRALVAGALLSAASARASEAPRVERVEPSNGATDVDPGTTEIRVVFDRKMRTDTFSFVGGGDAFPAPAGDPYWLGSRTCVLPVRLEPDHEYRFMINSERHHGFRDRDGVPAEPLAVRFRTVAGTGGSPAPAGGFPGGGEERLREAVLTAYSHRDRLGLDWGRLFAEHHVALAAADSPRAFAGAAAALLRPARDVHVWLVAGGETVPVYKREVARNFDLAGIRTVAPDLASLSGNVYSATLPGGIPYLLLGSLERSKVDEEVVLDAIRRAADAPGLVLDLRANGGGDEALARRIASCFATAPAVYARHVVRDLDAPGGFGAPVDRMLEPAEEGPRFRGRVIVLQGRFTLSSAEAMVLMMRTVPGCVTVGDTTWGGSGNPRPHDLGNGVVVMLPTWKATDPAGRELEGVGVPPDVVVEASPDAFRVGDPVLMRAAALLAGH